MKFTTQLSIDACRRRMLGRASEIPIFPDTIVEIDPPKGNQSEFAVRRVWKGKRNLFQYTMMEAKGSLASTPENKTDVTARIRVDVVGWAIILLIGFLVFALLNSPHDGGIGIVIGIVFFGMVFMDWYILYRIVDEIKE